MSSQFRLLIEAAIIGRGDLQRNGENMEKYRHYFYTFSRERLTERSATFAAKDLIDWVNRTPELKLYRRL
jgi:hypothetical protein